MNDPFKLFKDISLAYQRYLDSPFRLRYDSLRKERRNLLFQDKQLLREPLIELIPPYESSERTVSQACSQLGIPDEATDFITSGLFRSDIPLYKHQFEAWKHSRNGRAVIVTTGTGSGKTECYLLPVFAYLVEDMMRGWGAPIQPDADNLWWRNSYRPRQARIPQRKYESAERPKALRALMLYPMNALIEDQLSRIRKACDNEQSRKWFADKFGGHHFWFGRYNSVTPVSGTEDTSGKKTKLKNRLLEMDHNWKQAMASAKCQGTDDILHYFQNPEGSEMWSRWDMQSHPPDILITNYSMLNIMLMRELENNIFEHTKAWLEKDPKNNAFHLIVDELHTYRGTPGTEVGYLIRALLHRIGLEPDSQQLRIIATSASIINDHESRNYLEQLFGRDGNSFEILSGQQQHLPSQVSGISEYTDTFITLDKELTSLPLEKAASNLADAVGITSDSEPSEIIANAYNKIHALDSVQLACDGKPFTLKSLSSKLFRESSDNDKDVATRGLIRGLVHARIPSSEPGSMVAPLPLRIHFFFHNAGRLWACINSKCPGRTEVSTTDTEPPPVGRLFTEPVPRCDSCRSRVLELLYCQPCGEVFIAGYKKPDHNSSNAWFLSPDYPKLEQVPDISASLHRIFGEYLVFWPANGRAIYKSSNTTRSELKWMNGNHKWQSASLNLVSGRLTYGPCNNTQLKYSAGFAFCCNDDKANAFPTKCPHCGDNWYKRRINSPIRDLGSGFQRIMQLLSDEIMRQTPDIKKRKLVLFSDSRQDAAKLSTGIKRAHYLDNIRQIAFGKLIQQIEDSKTQHIKSVELYLRKSEFLKLSTKQRSQTLSEAEQSRFQELLKDIGDNATIVQLMQTDTTESDLQRPTQLTTFGSIHFNSLLDFVRTSLIKIGTNPGGPLPRSREYKDIHWIEILNWNIEHPGYRSELQPIEQTLRDYIEEELLQSIMKNVIFATGSRDFESLRLGFLWVNDSGPATTKECAAASVLRILARKFRWFPESEGKEQVPQNIHRYLKAVAHQNDIDAQTLQGDVLSILGESINQWLVIPRYLHVLTPISGDDNYINVFPCGRCGTIHLHASGSVCTVCLNQLPSTPHNHSTEPAADDMDFYEYLARCNDESFRLNCEELTGQTDNADRINRQRWFQEIFLDNELKVAKAYGVDLLSVTTTMEAGVDIGSLQAIGLANMPPTRFNYQQRVGRAGRRGLGMSVALTLCRGRSHDNYYFERPNLITAEPPPRPYVDVTRPEIAQRVVNKEVLRQAFGEICVSYSSDNVHGEFGSVGEWASYKQDVKDWITENISSIKDIANNILRRTKMDNIEGVEIIVKYVTNELLANIDRIVNSSHTHHALSERLASYGILPMFGFPTRMRFLHHAKPKKWPPKYGIIDRDIDIAISQFAPGAQSIKDDKLHTAVGVVEFVPTKNRPITMAKNPLRNTNIVGVCRRCQGLVTNDPKTGPCPYCSEEQGPQGYRIVELTEPPGFSTYWEISKHSEFRGNFDFTPRSLRARMGAELKEYKKRRNFNIGSGSARIYRINDNNGNDFEFRKLKDQDFWMVEEAFNTAIQTLPNAEQKRITQPIFDTTESSFKCALASISNTDVMVAGIHDIPNGLCLNPSQVEAKAAWYSFGFLVRRAVAVSLDIDESELEIGIQPINNSSTPFTPPTARIFISDNLENGAGYSTFLGDVGRFEELLHFVLGQSRPSWTHKTTPPDSFHNPLIMLSHSSVCTSSCYRCLREFRNMAYHPILDWRLGLDIARLALDPNTKIDLSTSYWSDLVSQIADPYFRGLNMEMETFGNLQGGKDVHAKEAIILIHPLWDSEKSNAHPEVTIAADEAENQGLKVTWRTVFHATRFPYE